MVVNGNIRGNSRRPLLVTICIFRTLTAAALILITLIIGASASSSSGIFSFPGQMPNLVLGKFQRSMIDLSRL